MESVKENFQKISFSGRKPQMKWRAREVEGKSSGPVLAVGGRRGQNRHDFYLWKKLPRESLNDSSSRCHDQLRLVSYSLVQLLVLYMAFVLKQPSSLKTHVAWRARTLEYPWRLSVLESWNKSDLNTKKKLCNIHYISTPALKKKL